MHDRHAIDPPIASVQRTIATKVLLALLLALPLSSCARQLPTSPSQALVHHGTLTPSTLDGIDWQIVVSVEPGTDPAALAADYGATLIDVQEGFALLERDHDPVDVVLGMRHDRRIASSESNMLALTAEARQKSWAFDDGFGSETNTIEQPATRKIGVFEAHQISTGAGMRVAILDTGIDPSHPLFANRIVAGHDFVDRDDDPTDVPTGTDADHDGVVDGAYGHGTHVAGIVAVVAPDAKLLIARVLDAEGRGDVQRVAAGIRWAVRNGANVINLSLGMAWASPAVSTALHEAYNQGVVVVASAGNAASDYPQEYPATSPEVIAVAACDEYRRPAPFTSYGDFVDIMAPGVLVRSAYPGNSYRMWSGTSMSAPFVSGTAALLVSLHPTWGIAQVLDRLRLGSRAAVQASAVQAGGLGRGALDVGAALAPEIGDLSDRALGPSHTAAEPRR